MQKNGPLKPPRRPIDMAREGPHWWAESVFLRQWILIRTGAGAGGGQAGDSSAMWLVGIPSVPVCVLQGFRGKWPRHGTFGALQSRECRVAYFVLWTQLHRSVPLQRVCSGGSLRRSFATVREKLRQCLFLTGDRICLWGSMDADRCLSGQRRLQLMFGWRWSSLAMAEAGGPCNCPAGTGPSPGRTHPNATVFTSINRCLETGVVVVQPGPPEHRPNVNLFFASFSFFSPDHCDVTMLVLPCLR